MTICGQVWGTINMDACVVKRVTINSNDQAVCGEVD